MGVTSLSQALSLNHAEAVHFVEEYKNRLSESVFWQEDVQEPQFELEIQTFGQKYKIPDCGFDIRQEASFIQDWEKVLEVSLDVRTVAYRKDHVLFAHRDWVKHVSQHTPSKKWFWHFGTPDICGLKGSGPLRHQEIHAPQRGIIQKSCVYHNILSSMTRASFRSGVPFSDGKTVIRFVKGRKGAMGTQRDVHKVASLIEEIAHRDGGIVQVALFNSVCVVDFKSLGGADSIHFRKS